MPAQWGSNLYCINGKTGAVVWSVPQGAQQRVVALDDVNGDGFRDVAVGFNTSSSCKVCSGATGALLWSTPTSDWTWAVDRVADCTGDGVNDVAVGDFDGYVYLLNGVDRQIVWRWLNPTGDKVMTIRGVPDLNGNGAPDIAAGSQLLYGGTGGYVYALEGNRDIVAVSDGLPAPSALRLGEAYPNPTDGSVRWSLCAERPGSVRVQIFGADGRCIRELEETPLPGGADCPVIWDGLDRSGAPAPTGTYFARFLFDGRLAGDRKLVLVR